MRKVKGCKVLLLLLLGLVCCLAIVISVEFSQAGSKKEKRQERENQEAYFLEEIKTILETENLYKSGVTMTKTEEEEGENEYQVLIHNKHIFKMSEDRREELQGKLDGLSFPDGSSRVSHVFLEL